LRKAEIEPEDWEALQNAMVEMQGMPFQFIFNDPANPEPITVEGVFETVRDAARHDGIDLLVVDYIGIMGTKREFKENWLKVAYISRELKRLAMAANIPVVALCQVNRMAQGKMPTMAELAQSGAVEQDADGIIFLHRPESHEDKSVNPKDVAGFYAMQEAGSVYISISVAKQRNGSIGTVNVMFDPNVMRYNEIMRE
jgi:replicative DNA helicase